MSNSTALEPSPTKCGARLRNKPGSSCSQPAGHRTSHPGEGKCWLHGGLTPITHGRYSKVIRTEIQELLQAMEGDPDPLNVLPDLNMVRALLTDFLNRYEENRDAMLAWYASWNGRPWRTSDLELITQVLAAYEGRLRELGEWEEAEPGHPPLERLELEKAQIMIENMREAYAYRPREVLDIADAYKMAAEATKIVERVEKIRARNAVSLEDFNRVMTEMGRTVEASLSVAKVRSVLSANDIHVEDEAVMMAVADTLRNNLIDLWMTIRVR